MKPIERLMQYFDFKSIKPTRFEKDTGLSNGYFGTQLKRNADIGTGILEIIIDNCLDLDIIWLLTGKGEMLQSTQSTPEAIRSNSSKKGIPLLSIAAIAGFGNSSFAIQESDVKDYYVVPKFKDRKIDFMIEISGSSMYPKYNSGDVVACTILRESRFIQWNKVHVIGTQEQGILVKRIRKTDDDNSFLLVSDNTAYDPFVISCDEITGIAIVVGVIRLE
jgi:Predicted transcriptional regulator